MVTFREDDILPFSIIFPLPFDQFIRQIMGRHRKFIVKDKIYTLLRLKWVAVVMAVHDLTGAAGTVLIGWELVQDRFELVYIGLKADFSLPRVLCGGLQLLAIWLLLPKV
jgi:hypothetical protein